MRKQLYLFMLAISAMLLMTQCTRDLVLTPLATEPEINEALAWTPDQGILKFLSDEDKQNAVAEDLESIDRMLKNPKAEDLRSRGAETHIPAGSNNALAAAIAAAGADDVIILDAGDHTETGTVVVNKKVKIYGEKGANLIFSNTPSSPIANFSPAFHIQSGAEGTIIKGLVFKGNDPIPGVCVFIDSANSIKILQNKFENWQLAIVGYTTDRLILTQNKIAVNTGWQIGAIPLAHGIIISDGNRSSIVMNEIYGGVFGIFTGGNFGLSFSNNTYQCVYGQVLCKVPPGELKINNRLINTKGSTQHWKVKYNMSNNNLAAGYIVIDGANGNWLQHNCADGNGTYGIELTGESSRFGFLAPKSFNNTVIAYRNLTVKDCGENNAVIGGIWVNTNEDPCY